MTKLTGVRENIICGYAKEGDKAKLYCPFKDQMISEILFASYGNPTVNCNGGYTTNIGCDSSPKAVYECLGRNGCSLTYVSFSLLFLFFFTFFFFSFVKRLFLILCEGHQVPHIVMCAQV